MIKVQKIANGYLVHTPEATYHANSLDEALVRMKVAFGEMTAPEAPFAFAHLKKAA